MLKYRLENYTKGGVNLENKLGTDINQNINKEISGEEKLRESDSTHEQGEASDIANKSPLNGEVAADDEDGLSWDEFISATTAAPTDWERTEENAEDTTDSSSESVITTDDQAGDTTGEQCEPEESAAVPGDDEVIQDDVISDEGDTDVSIDKDGDDDSHQTESTADGDVNSEDSNDEADDLPSENEAKITESDNVALEGNDDAGEHFPAPDIHDEPSLEQSPPMKEERYDPEHPRKVDMIFDFLELFVFTLVAVLMVTTFFVRHSVVDGDSMLNTLHNGDTLIISDLFYEPECGDVIVIESTELGKAIVKRVIAVGGQKVMVKPDGIYVNDLPLYEDDYVYTDNKDYFYDLRRFGNLPDNPTFRFIPGSHYEFVVPEGEVFVMGDHRSDSKDSRDLGTLPVDAILGKVLWRVLPFDSFGSVE